MLVQSMIDCYRTGLETRPTFYVHSRTGLQLTRFTGRVEGSIDGDLQSRRQLIGLGGQSDDRQQLGMLSAGHAFGVRGGRVRMYTVATSVCDRDRDIDHLLGQRIDLRRRRHKSLDFSPRALEQHWIEGKRVPEVVDEVGAARSSNVIEDRFDARVGFRIR